MVKICTKIEIFLKNYLENYQKKFTADYFENYTSPMIFEFFKMISPMIFFWKNNVRGIIRIVEVPKKNDDFIKTIFPTIFEFFR